MENELLSKMAKNGLNSGNLPFTSKTSFYLWKYLLTQQKDQDGRRNQRTFLEEIVSQE